MMQLQRTRKCEISPWGKDIGANHLFLPLPHSKHAKQPLSNTTANQQLLTQWHDPSLTSHPQTTLLPLKRFTKFYF